MSLLVGCILIYHYDLEWGWYVLAAAMYASEWHQHYLYHRSLHTEITELRIRLGELLRSDDLDD